MAISIEKQLASLKEDRRRVFAEIALNMKHDICFDSDTNELNNIQDKITILEAVLEQAGE